MTGAAFLDLSSLVALVILGLALLVSLVRIVIGPSLADRVLALDLMTVVAIGFIGGIAIRTGLMLYLDIAIALALLGFLATVALARYIIRRGLKVDQPQEEARP